MTLRITEEAYVGNRQRVTMQRDEAAKFKDATKKAFEKALALPGTQAMGWQISCANNDVLVLKAGPGQHNACVLASQTVQALDDVCYQELLTARALQQKIQALINGGTIPVDHIAAKKFTKFYLNKTHFEKMRGVDRPVAHLSTDPAHKAAHTTEEVLRGRINTFDEKAKVTEAVGFVRHLQHGLIGYHIMEHLTPGRGGEAWVVWDPDKVDAGADLRPEDRASWMERPSWIALMHEMVHAWRLVTGRCVFRPEPLIEEYYEEAMTVGLPPYDRCRFTENAFRSGAGLPLRTHYGQSTKVLTDKAIAKHLYAPK